MEVLTKPWAEIAIVLVYGEVTGLTEPTNGVTEDPKRVTGLEAIRKTLFGVPLKIDSTFLANLKPSAKV